MCLPKPNTMSGNKAPKMRKNGAMEIALLTKNLLSGAIYRWRVDADVNLLKFHQYLQVIGDSFVNYPIFWHRCPMIGCVLRILGFLKRWAESSNKMIVCCLDAPVHHDICSIDGVQQHVFMFPQKVP